ncbi:MAG TPA: hypothetical protein VN611_07135 [Patescibacteria group bacterium]|nr:hypothetical protein [Patescibacteria group bacterium]
MTTIQTSIDLLNEKLQILEAITANTEQQRRLLKRNSLPGVTRLLREREQLIRQLAAVVRQLSSENIAASSPALSLLHRTILTKQQELLASANLLRAETSYEKQQLARQLNAVKTKRRIQRHYEPVRTLVYSGRRLNIKG